MPVTLGQDHDVWTDLQTRMTAFVRRRIRDQHAAEDVAQEILLRLHRNLGDLRDDDRLHAFAYRVARNAIIDHYRAGAGSREVLSSPDDLAAQIGADDADGLVSLDAGPGGRRELACCLRPLVQRLAEPYREALLLTDLGDLSQTQAAAHVGLSVPGMKARVQRGRAQLRELLTACCSVRLDPSRRIGEVDPRGPCDCAASPPG